MNSPETASFLEKTELFSSLEKEELTHLAELLQPKKYAKGQIVIHQGDFGDSMYIISRGEVDVVVRNQEGAESVIGHLKEGDLFGEMSLLTGSPRAASVRVCGDAVFLTLFKNDFDEFLANHPRLAVLFSRQLAKRIKNIDSLYIYRMEREEELKRLLYQEQKQHLTHLTGKTNQFQTIEKKIEESSQNDKPLMIFGPEGSATEEVARLVHRQSNRRDKPFLIVDLAGGNEWKTYSARMQFTLKGKEREEENQLFERFQISSIFGHQKGAMVGAEASRLGYLELADGGTIVLKNIDRLSPGTRERLFFYLLENKFYRLGASQGVTVDSRVIATFTSSSLNGENQQSLQGKVPDLLWENTINLPPLTSRRRDIPMIAQALLEKHTTLAVRGIKNISPHAMNILVRYSWPGNDRELESVIERGVLVCDGETLLAEHIFLGLTPYSEKGRFNLLRISPFRHFFKNLKLRASFRAVTLMAMIGVVLLTFLGTQDFGKNLGIGIVWYYWWPFLLLSFLVLGRSYCSICPIDGLVRLSKKLGSLNRAAPRIFNYIGAALAGVLALGLFWGEYFFLVKEIPVRTALLLGTIAVSAVAVNFVFKAEVWCRYICPMGYFSGLFSCLSSVELRANNNVCSSQCRSTNCYKGDGKQEGCPMKLFPVSLTSNQFCKMCGTCARNCPYHSIHLDLRWPGAEIWENKEPNLITSLSIPAFLGILFPLFVHEKLHSHSIGDLSFSLIYLASVLGSVVLFMAASLSEGLSNFKSQIRAYGFSYLPLAFTGHLALLLPYLVSGLMGLLSFSLPGQFHHELTSSWPQRLILVLGILWSGWTLRKLSDRKSLIAFFVHGMLMVLLGLALMVLIGG